MITLNGRFKQDQDNFTVHSTIGKSVVDYVIVQSDYFVEHSEFHMRLILDLVDQDSATSRSKECTITSSKLP